MNKVQIVLTGETKEEVEAKLVSLYNNYHPMAYCVRMGEITLDESGKWFSAGSRSTSCD